MFITSTSKSSRRLIFLLTIITMLGTLIAPDLFVASAGSKTNPSTETLHSQSSEPSEPTSQVNLFEPPAAIASSSETGQSREAGAVNPSYACVPFANPPIDPSPMDCYTKLIADTADTLPLGIRTPVILIHGIHGNGPDPEAHMDADYFRTLISYLNLNSTFKLQYKFYRFHYRSDYQSVWEIARSLRNRIDDLVKQGEIPESRKVVLLAHSMGGLVARSYMNEHNTDFGDTFKGQRGGKRVLRLITLATPHHGTEVANGVSRSFGTPSWGPVFDAFDVVYWTRQHGCAPCSVDPAYPNRSDLRFDNFNGLWNNNSNYLNIPSEQNGWLRNLPKTYDQLISAYYGYLGNNEAVAAVGNLDWAGLADYFYASQGDDFALQLGSGVVLTRIELGDFSSPITFVDNDGLVPTDSGMYKQGSVGKKVQCGGYNHNDMKEGIGGNCTVVGTNIRKPLRNLILDEFLALQPGTPPPTNDTTPPTVKISSPTSSSSYSTTGSTLTLRGTATDNVGIAQVTCANDRGGSCNVSGTTNWTANVTGLQSGTNILTVRAGDAAGNIGVKTLTVTYTPPPVCDNGTSESYRVNGGPPLHPNGTLIKGRNDQTVYLIQNGQKRGIPTQAILNGLYQQTNGGFQNKDVVTVADDELSRYATGAVVTGSLPSNGRSQADGRLIQRLGGSEISIVTGGNRRPFASESTFLGLGYLYCNVIAVSDYDSYPAGIPVDANTTLKISTVEPNAQQARDWGGTVTYTFTVVDGNGTPVSGAAVGGQDNLRGIGVFLATSSTDDHGQGTYTTTVPDAAAIDVFDIIFMSDKAGYTGSDAVTRQVQVNHFQDSSAPTLTITSPTTNSNYETNVSPITLAGISSDNVGVTQVTWANDRGGNGTATGTMNWTASGIPLANGFNVLTVTAQDAAGNSETSDIVVNNTATSSNNSTILATGLSNPNSIATDGTDVFWTDYGSNSVKKVSVNGGSVTTLFSGTNTPSGIAVDGNNLYFGFGASVMRVPRSGGAAITLANGNSAVLRLGVDTSSVYWTGYGDGTINKVSLNGGAIITLASGQPSPFGITLAGNKVCWTEYNNPGSVRCVGTGGGAVTILAGNSNTPGIASDGNNIYWTENVRINDGKVHSISINGGTPNDLASGLDRPYDLNVDGTSAFWTEGYTGGFIKQLSLNGGTPIVLASGLADPTAITSDSASVYWVERNDGGQGTGTLKKVAKVNIPGPIPQDFSWQFKTSLPQGRSSASVAVYNNRIYVIGGSNLFSHYRYDPASDSWSTMAGAPGNGISEGGATVVGSKIYATDSYDSQMKIYDPATNQWTTGSARNSQFKRGPCVVGVNGKVYVIGGGDASLNATNVVQMYDPATDGWTNKTSMPTARSFASAAVINNLIYVIGGLDDTSAPYIKRTVEVYDPATDSWTSRNPAPVASYIAGFTALNNRLYIIGGGNGSGAVNTVSEYDPVADTWRSLSPIQTARYQHVAAAVNNKLYVIGGANESGTLSSVEEGISTGPALNVSLTPKTQTVRTTESVLFTVSINTSRSAAMNITLNSSNGSAAAVPASVTIQTGATTASFSATGIAVGSATITATLPGNLGGGSDTANLTVQSGSPTVLTTGAGSITNTTGSLSGNVNPNGLNTTAWFEWSTDSGLSGYTSTVAQSVGSGTAGVNVSANLTGLVSNSTYYYRAVGANSAGTTRGSIQAFTTSGTECGDYAVAATISNLTQPLRLGITGSKLFSTTIGKVQVIDLTSNTVVANVPFTPYPNAYGGGIAFLNGKAYVPLGNLGSQGQVAVIDTTTNAVNGYIPVSAEPFGIAAYNGKLYLTHNVQWSNGAPSTVDVIDPVSNLVTATINAGVNTQDIAIVPTLNRGYAVNYTSANVTVINLGTNAATGTIALPINPTSAVLAGGKVYVAGALNNSQYGQLVVIDPATNSITSRIDIGRDPASLAVLNNRLFVVNQSDRNLMIVNTDTNAIVKTLGVGLVPLGVAVDSSTGKIYVANQSSPSISVISCVSCTYAVAPTSQPFTAAGGNGVVSITAGNGCAWSAISNAGFISLTSAGSGSGNGTVTYSVGSNNSSSPRQGTLTIAGQTVTVNQSGAGPAGLQYFPLSHPIRLLDTRSGQLGYDTPGTPLAGGTIRTELARVSYDGVNIPAGAQAIVGNATVVNNLSGSANGYVILYPSGTTQPTASNLNYVPDQVVPNAFTVGLGADGKFNIYAHSTTHFIVDITGYYAPPGAGGLYYHPLQSPIRLLESRPGQPGYDTPGAPLAGGTVRGEPARNLSYNGVTIPITAQTIVGNATVVNNLPNSANGYVILYPSSTTQPMVSNLNYVSGQVVPNAFTVTLGSDGKFNIYTASTTDFIVDVSGYFSTDATDQNGQGLLYTSLASPVRLLETRAGQQGCDTPQSPLTGGAVRVEVARNACTNIPAAVQAIVGNATVVNNLPGSQQGAIILYPSNAAQPVASNLNYVPGQVVPNAFTVGLGTDGAFKIYAFTTTDFIVDVTGYFSP